MANDGTLIFNTKIDETGFKKGLGNIGGVAQKGLTATGKILEGAAASVMALGGAAVKVGSDFEAGMSQVQAVSGASSQELEKLKEKAKEMGASTKFSATESAEALNYMAMAGWKTEDMLGGIEGIMNLAAASGEDLATTSDIVTDALTAFGMSASESTHFADILAAASSNANTNVGMMGETFKYVAPLAGSLGYSAEDTATAIGLMANAGIKGSQAGTSLRSIMTRLAKPTKESQEAMNALGLSITDSSGKMKPLSEIVGDMRKGFAGLTEDEKATYAAMLGGQEAMSGLLAIVNASDKDFEKLSGAINNCNGSAAEMAEIMQDNLQGQITILQSGLEGLGVSLYETMQGTAKDVVKEVQGMVQQLQNAFNAGGFSGLVGAFGNVLAQIVGRIAEAAPLMIDAGVNLVSSFCDGLINAPGIGDSVANLVTSLVIGLLSCGGEIWTTAIVLIGQLAEGIATGAPQMTQAATDAVGQILLAFAEWTPNILQAGADIIVSLASGIANAFPSLVPQITACILDLITIIADNADSIVDAGINIAIALADGLISALPILASKAPNIIIKICDALDRNLIKIAKSGAALTLKLVEGVLSAIPEFAKNLPKIFEAVVRVLRSFNFMSLGVKIVTEIADGLVEAGSTLLNAAKNTVESVHTYFTYLPGKISEAISGAIVNIAQWGRQIYNEAVTAVRDTIAQIVNFFVELPEKIAYYLGYVIGAFIRWDQEINTWVSETIPAIISHIAQFFSELPNKIWIWLVNTVTKITAWGQQMRSSAKTAITNMISNIISLMSGLPGKIAVHLSNTVSKVSAWGRELASKGAAAAKGLFDAVVDGVSGLPAKMADIGSNIVSGIWDGISRAWDSLRKKFEDLIRSLLKGAKNALDINSPSGAFRDEVGQWIMPGTMQGVKKSMPKVLREMKERAGELLAAMRGTVEASKYEISLGASRAAGVVAMATAGTVVYNDNTMRQENNYHVPVATPSEVNKAQREAFRKFVGGVK